MGQTARRWSAAVSAPLAVLLTMAAWAAPAHAAGGTVPTQYVAKLYSEGLGRGPDQGGWAGMVAFFDSRGCDRASLREQGDAVFGSPEYAGLAYTSSEKVITAYRAVLNREPDATGLSGWTSALDGGMSTTAFVDALYGSAEFGSLVPSICSTTSADYDFGIQAAASPAVSDPGYTGAEAGLQAILNNSAAGAVVALAPRAVVHLTSPLTIPAGVRLGTTGNPGPTRYAHMGRLVRDPGFAGEAVKLMSGASLTNVWVDGGRLRESSYDRLRFNVRMYGGTGTALIGNRIGNTAGATNVESYGAGDGYPCAGLKVQGNLIDAYTSKHSDGLWSDGVSMHCEDVDVSGNTVIDATDVGIIDFALVTGVPQKSQVHDNVVIQAGQSSFGMIGADPFFDPGAGDAAGQATRSIAGGSFHANVLWTSSRTHSTFGIIVGTKAWFGADAHNATGGTFRDNTTGSLSMRVKTAIVVSGVLNTTVTGNTFNTSLYNVGGSCPTANIGASVSAGFAGGSIQGPYTDALYSGCLDFNGGES